MTNVFGWIWGRVDDGHAGRHDAEEESDGDAGDGGDVQLLDQEGSLVEEDVKEVHVEVSLAEAVVQLLASLEQPEVDEAARLVVAVASRRGHNPEVGAETA